MYFYGNGRTFSEAKTTEAAECNENRKAQKIVTDIF